MTQATRSRAIGAVRRKTRTILILPSSDAVLLRHHVPLLVLANSLLVFLQGSGELMGPIILGDEVEIAHPGRVQRRLQGYFSGAGDGPWGKSVLHVRVIGVLCLEVAAGHPAPVALAIEDGGIGLQSHPPPPAGGKGPGGDGGFPV